MAAAGGRVVALDIQANRAALVRENATRLGYDGVTVAVGDARRPPLTPATFDRVLVDAPCSGTGTLRRNPEIKWRLAAGDLERFAALQTSLLERAAERVRPGGRLVYSTCSMEPERLMRYSVPAKWTPPFVVVP